MGHNSRHRQGTLMPVVRETSVCYGDDFLMGNKEAMHK